MEMKPAFDDVGRPPSAELVAQLEGERREQTRLQRDMLDFIDEESKLVKTLAGGNGKKDLAREVVRLRAMVKTIKRATEAVRPGAATFSHAEAFRLMTYVQTNSEAPEPAKALRVWNSRDGVTPFIVHIGAETYQCSQPMGEVHYDLPDGATHKWVTRTEREVLFAWRRTLDKAVEQGKLDPGKAEAMRDSLEAARSWHYGIGLVNLETGRFTDDEVLSDA